MTRQPSAGAGLYVRRLRQKVPARIAEWLCAGQIFVLGWGLLLFPATFDRPGLSVFSDFMPTARWAWISLALGSFRLVALFVNGHRPLVSGPMRIVGAIAGAGLFGLFLGRFVDISTEGSIAIGVYPFAAWLVADIWNGARASTETFSNWRHRNASVVH